MKTCIIFPGIGYHSDKPLLYFSKKLAFQYGYRLIEITYPKFEGDLLHCKKERDKAVEIGVKYALEQLKEYNLQNDSILCISKSIGTAISCRCFPNNRAIMYTPIEQTLDYIPNNSIVFHGKKDPWLDHTVFMKSIKNQTCSYFVYEDLNHSLESDNIINNIEILKDCIKKTNDFLMEL